MGSGDFVQTNHTSFSTLSCIYDYVFNLHNLRDIPGEVNDIAKLQLFLLNDRNFSVYS